MRNSYHIVVLTPSIFIFDHLHVSTMIYTRGFANVWRVILFQPMHKMQLKIMNTCNKVGNNHMHICITQDKLDRGTDIDYFFRINPRDSFYLRWVLLRFVWLQACPGLASFTCHWSCITTNHSHDFSRECFLSLWPIAFTIHQNLDSYTRNWVSFIWELQKLKKSCPAYCLSLKMFFLF